LNVQPNDLFAAASYYRESGKDLNQALVWITEATEKYDAAGTNAFWVYRAKAEIEAELKNYKVAIATAELAKSKATEAENNQYIKFNEDNITKWKGLL